MSADVTHAPRMSGVARLLSVLILGYQRFLSPLLSPRCRFEPSCSAYAGEAVAAHGAARGSLLAVWRLLRCQPFGTPGYDPVPERHHAAVDRREAALRGVGPC